MRLSISLARHIAVRGPVLMGEGYLPHFTPAYQPERDTGKRVSTCGRRSKVSGWVFWAIAAFYKQGSINPRTR